MNQKIIVGLVSLLTCVIVVVVFVLYKPLVSGPQIEVVTSGGQDTSYFDTSVAIDSNDVPHIVYYGLIEEGGDEIYGLNYAVKRDGRWNIESIDPIYAKDCSILLDVDDEPHVVYYLKARYAGEKSTVKYAFKNGDSWYVENVSYGINPSLALDTNNRPHICYYDYNINELIYTFKPDTEWVKEAFPVVGEGGALAFDSNNNPHMIYDYYNITTGVYAVIHGFKHGSSWAFETVGSEYDESPSSFSLTITNTDELHVCYSYIDVYPYHGLKYALRDSSGWHIQTVDSENAGWDNSLAVDSQGNVYISYQSPERESPQGKIPTVYLAKLKGDEWDIITVESGFEDNFRDTSITLDSKGNPHIAYVCIKTGYTATYLKYYSG